MFESVVLLRKLCGMEFSLVTGDDVLLRSKYVYWEMYCEWDIDSDTECCKWWAHDEKDCVWYFLLILTSPF